MPRISGPPTKKQEARTKLERKKAKSALQEFQSRHAGNTLRLAKQLEGLTDLESRVTILGYVQRGGSPSAVDRLLATRLGTACADLIKRGAFGRDGAPRAAKKPSRCPWKKWPANARPVPLDHPWVTSARLVGTSLLPGV